MDYLPYNPDHFRVPLHFPTCCLPAGVDILLQESVSTVPRLPARTYSVVLSENDATRLYASCLCFYDEVRACCQFLWQGMILCDTAACARLGPMLVC